MKVVVTLLLVALVLTPVAMPRVSASDSRIARPELVKLVGTWGPPVEGHVAAEDLTLELGGQTARFQVDDAAIIQGDRMGSEFLTEVAQYKPALRLQGPPELLQKLREAAPGTKVTVSGYRHLGGRTFLVGDVTIAAP